jgi:Tfp pilus assembly protein PilN
MKTFAIAELEEGALVATIASVVGGDLRVERVARVPLADLGRESLTKALRSPAAECLRGHDGVHVVLGERRMVHFVLQLPRMKAVDLLGVALREALRLTGMPTQAEVLVAPKLLPGGQGARLRLAVTALARNLWEPLQEAFRAAELPLLGLYSAESCLAAAVPGAADGASAVLESNAGRARFVLCESGHPVQVRRFLLGSDTSGEALVAQLAMELPRTLDWLRETGHATPQTLVLGSRLGVDAAAAGMLQGDGLVIVDGRRPCLADPEGQVVSLGVAELLGRLQRGTALPSLLAQPHLELPWPRSRYVAAAAAAVVGFLGSAAAVVDFQGLQAAREAHALTASELQGAQARLAEAERAVAARDSTDPALRRVQSILGQRRPVSRLVAELCNAASDDLRLDELRFANNDAVVLTGSVEGRSRQEALAALARFGRGLRSVPFLDTTRQEEVGEGAAGANRFRFKITMQWRKSE